MRNHAFRQLYSIMQCFIVALRQRYMLTQRITARFEFIPVWLEFVHLLDLRIRAVSARYSALIPFKLASACSAFTGVAPRSPRSFLWSFVSADGHLCRHSMSSSKSATPIQDGSRPYMNR